MSTGGHFLSDVLFSGVMMALVVIALHTMIFGRAGRAAPQRHEVARSPALGPFIGNLRIVKETGTEP
jgi:hypothetical protein